jgi:hypothetical protein
VVEENLHRASVGSRQRQREGLVGSDPARGKEVEARIAPVDDAWRTQTSLVPDPCGAPLLPDPRLILTPDLKLLMGMLGRDGLKPGRELLF